MTVTALGWWSYVNASRARALAIAIAPIEQRVLEDGSTIELNRGAVVTVRFTPSERLVRLERGEVFFKVAKNNGRPFIVEAAGVRGRAVGTAFDVRLDAAAVAVLVTEGQVEVNGSPASTNEPPAKSEPLPFAVTPVVGAGQRAIVSLGSSGPTALVAAVSADELTRLLAWQPKWLDFTAAPLSDIVAEFNFHNAIQLTIAEPALAGLRITTTFRSDNLAGFIRLLDLSLGVRAERRGANQIALRRAP
jgi:transmembrane sensor